MKKLVLMVIILVGISGIGFAGNSERIEELTKEGQALVQRKQQMVETIQRIEVRLIQIQAIIDELSKMEKANEERDPKAEKAGKK